MIGAIIGDIVGSRFENNNKSKYFELFDKNCRPTDDSIMSLAIANAILTSKEMATLYYFEKMFPSMALDENGKQSQTIFDILDDAVDKVIPEGTSVKVDDDGVMCVWASDDDLIPDFSSFDIDAHGKTKVHRENPNATNGRSDKKGKRTI